MKAMHQFFMKVLRKKLLFLTLVYLHSAQSQISYTPIFLDSCSYHVTPCNWYLTDQENRYDPIDFDLMHVIVPKSGTYQLGSNLNSATYAVVIPNEAIVIDTFYVSRLQFTLYYGYTEYYYCDTLANGELSGYYPNGQLKISGISEGGLPVSNVNEYYPSGNVLSTTIPNEKGVHYIRYYENGQIKVDHNTKKGRSILYFENGRMASKSTYDHSALSKEFSFYESGQPRSIRRKRLYQHYDVDGRLTEEIERKRIGNGRSLIPYNKDEERPTFYDYTWRSYDSTGTMSRIIYFSESDFLQPPLFPNFANIPENRFEKIVFYKDAAPHIMILNPDPIYSSLKNKLIIYENLDGVWFETKRITVDQIYELIRFYSA